VTPTIKAHLVILSRLGTVLHDPTVRAAITARDPAERILAAIEQAERNLNGGPKGH
jgi:hypothetical protein